MQNFINFGANLVPQLNLLSLSTKFENLIGSTVQGARVRLGLEPLDSAQPTSCTDLVGWARAHLSRPIRIRGPVVKRSDSTPYRFSPESVSLSLADLRGPRPLLVFFLLAPPACACARE